MDQGTLFDVILAANYLEIKGLFYDACETVAKMLKGKSPQELRQFLNIESDHPALEGEQALEESESSEKQEPEENESCKEN